MAYKIVADSSSPITVDQFRSAVQGALRSWSQVACGGVHFDYGGVTFAEPAAGDGTNSISWVTSGWTNRGWRADAAAITDVQYEKGVEGIWRIVEADMYLNAESHHWVLEGDGGPGIRDVRSVVTHEGGHVLGLLHPCEPIGEEGAPRCSEVAGAELTTMYPIYRASQFQLSVDDEAGECFLYQGGDCDAGTCTNDAEAPTCQGGVCGVGAATCQGDGCPEPLGGTIGDLCDADAECGVGTCAGSGYCAVSCVADHDCGQNSRCESNGRASICTDGRLAMGMVCQAAAECIGGECLVGANVDPVCTRSCMAGQPSCPRGWRCESVEDRDVCAPESMPTAGGGSCSMVTTAPATKELDWLLSASLTAAVLSLRRGRCKLMKRDERTIS